MAPDPRLRLPRAPGDKPSLLGLPAFPAAYSRRLLRRARRLCQGVRGLQGQDRSRLGQLLPALRLLLRHGVQGGRPDYRDVQHRLSTARVVSLLRRVRRRFSGRERR